MYRIYVITNKKNNKKYIGVTTKTVEYRWLQHQKLKGCRALYNALKSHGANSFFIEEIYNAFDLNSMNDMEQFFIKFFDSMTPNGYNLTSGGLNYIRTAESKMLSSRIMKERHKKENLIKNIAQISIEKRKAIVGINFTTFQILRFTDITLAKKQGFSPSNVLSSGAKYANGMMWYYDNGESDDVLIQKTKDLNIQTKGKQTWLTCDKEKRLENMRKGSKKKPILGVSVNNYKIIEYESVHAALRDGFSTSSIYECLNGNAKTGQKYVWFYKTTNNLQEYVNIAKQILNL